MAGWVGGHGWLGRRDVRTSFVLFVLLFPRFQIRHWHEAHRQYIRDLIESISKAPSLLTKKIFGYSIISAMADGTNMPAAQGWKGHNLKFKTKHCHIPVEDLAPFFAGEHDNEEEEDKDKEEEYDAVSVPLPPTQAMTAAVMCDLQQLPESTGGREVLALMDKQITNMGGHTWSNHSDKNSVLKGEDDRAPTAFHIDFQFMATDQGPDQKSAHDSIAVITQAMHLFIYFRNWCFLHIAHLMTKRHLKHVERFGFKNFFGSVAKTINCWRTGSNAKKLKRHVPTPILFPPPFFLSLWPPLLASFPFHLSSPSLPPLPGPSPVSISVLIPLLIPYPL